MKNNVHLSQVHTIVRTILLVDIPAGAFLIACAVIGWPVAITMHTLFFWLGLIAFGSIAIIGIAKLESKTLIPIGRDREYFRLEIERQEQQLQLSQEQHLLPPPSPDLSLVGQLAIEYPLTRAAPEPPKRRRRARSRLLRRLPFQTKGVGFLFQPFTVCSNQSMTC